MSNKIPDINDAFRRVGAIVRRMRIAPHRVDDAMGDGLLGVAAAKARFKADKGVDFWTYATAYAEGYIQHGLRRDARNPLAPDGDVEMEHPVYDSVEDRVYVQELLERAQRHTTKQGVNAGELLASIIEHGDVVAGGEVHKMRRRTIVPFFRNLLADAR